MNPAVNPYLPLWEYIPDGEPHVFENRLYVYGSHDKAEGKAYCEQDYVTWSAPLDNLADWRYEGVIYRKEQDPSNADGRMQLWAPDVAQGPDGRYYLYYCFAFYPEIGVAVSNSPAGPFTYYGHVRYPDGSTLRDPTPFDPAIFVDEDGRIYLYYGFAPAEEKEMHLPELSSEQVEHIPQPQRGVYKTMKRMQKGEYAMAVELEADMVTVKAAPVPVIPGGRHTKETSFEGHGFFEAASMRKIGQKYYFLYSSHKSHELCYATSEKPMEGFVFGGTVISNGDIGFHGRQNPVNTIGNNHGSLVNVNGRWYVFYHRQTNGTEFSRQGCAELVQIDESGKIEQVEMTSCGLNNGPLPADGSYPAAIACHLTSPTTMQTIDYSSPVLQTQTRIVQRQNDVFITAIQDSTVLGYKYFAFDGIRTLGLELRGDFAGRVQIFDAEPGTPQGHMIAEKAIQKGWPHWSMVTAPVSFAKGTHALYLRFLGKGALEFRSMSFFPCV